MSKFVNATEVTKLVLSDGDWVEVKNRLGYGEEQRLASSGASSMRDSKDEDGSKEMVIDWEKYSIDKIFIWVVNWNFKDDSGKDVKLTRSAISALDSSYAQEINDLLDIHIEKMQDLKVKIIG